MLKLLISGLLILLLCMIVPFPAYSSFLYKSYIVRHDRGTDILCDPYIVQKHDWVYKLFRQKGEIAHKDFPEFLNIFKRINPHIHNINRIHPGQHIFIPLKKLDPGALPGQSSGIVTIPFITISSIEDIIKASLTEYEIQKGDCISRLVAQEYGLYGTGSYRKGIELFKFTNPNVNNLNCIYPGQIIYMPDPSIQKEQWYQSLFDNSGNIILKPLARIRQTPVSPFQEAANILDARLLDNGTYYFPRHGEEDFQLDLSRSPVMEFKDKARIIFPKENIKKSDLKAIKSFWKNVKVLPILHRASHKASHRASREEILDSIFLSIQKDILKKQLSFSDHGVKVKVLARWIIDKSSPAGNKSHNVCVTLIESQDEQIPDSICRYLYQHDITIKDILRDKKCAKEKSKEESRRTQYQDPARDVTSIDTLDRRAFVNDLLTAIGYNYAQNVSISFPYAGIQVEATSNLVSKSDGKMLLVDFGDLYGDAILAVKKTGLDIIRIKEEDGFSAVIEKLLCALGVSYTDDPTFLAAKRPAVYNTSLTIPGFLVANRNLPVLPERSQHLTGKSKILLATVPLDNEVIQFLTEQDIKVIMMIED